MKPCLALYMFVPSPLKEAESWTSGLDLLGKKKRSKKSHSLRGSVNLLSAEQTEFDRTRGIQGFEHV